MAGQRPRYQWSGVFGRNYEYVVYTFPSKLKMGQEGNYIFCKLGPGDFWLPIYIGQGDLGVRTQNPDHPVCLRKKLTTHVHAHLNAQERDRLAEQDDLLEAYPQAYLPTGCNQRRGW